MGFKVCIPCYQIDCKCSSVKMILNSWAIKNRWQTGFGPHVVLCQPLFKNASSRKWFSWIDFLSDKHGNNILSSWTTNTQVRSLTQHFKENLFTASSIKILRYSLQIKIQMTRILSEPSYLSGTSTCDQQGDSTGFIHIITLD